MKKLYRLTEDLPNSGKKAGDVIPLVEPISRRMRSITEPVEDGDEDEDEETPTKTWKNEEIIVWLSEHGVSDAKGTKEELLKEVKKVLKG